MWRCFFGALLAGARLRPALPATLVRVLDDVTVVEEEPELPPLEAAVSGLARVWLLTEHIKRQVAPLRSTQGRPGCCRGDTPVHAEAGGGG